MKVKERKVTTPDNKDWTPTDKLLKDLMEELNLKEQDEDEDMEDEEPTDTEISDEEPAEAEKMMFGSKGDDYFYVIEPGDNPASFTIISAEDVEVFKPNVDAMKIEDFVATAAIDLELDSISWDFINKHDLLGLEEEKEEEEIPGEEERDLEIESPEFTGEK